MVFALIIFMNTVREKNNISVITWWSVLLVEETMVPGENQKSVNTH
jgi:hypothetical protein